MKLKKAVLQAFLREKMKEKIEILAPCGNFDSLKAAVFSGADAVYLAGQSFGARAAAKNFSNDELRETMKFCRGRGVKLYVVVNTLIKQSEFSSAMKFIEFLCEIAVDAVIVQDFGLLKEIRRCAPSLEVHASTQMSVHSASGARFLSQQGVKRVVLARELSLSEIREINSQCDIETECFVHGALCVSVSGQCYFSANLGSRSGNRGMCAQTCRLPFSCGNNNEYALSLKDLSIVDEIKKLENAGVASAKIEGRMKRPEYVAAAVSAAKKAVLGEEVPIELKNGLENVFSRSGFTKGYFNAQIDEKMLGVRTKENVVAANEKTFASLRSLYRGEMQRIGVDFAVFNDEKIKITVSDQDGNCAEQIIPYENVQYLSAERCKIQLSKTGGTPFYVNNIKILEDGVPLSVSTLNNVRRELLKTLLTTREESTSCEFLYKNDYNKKNKKSNTNNKISLIGSFKSVNQLSKACYNLHKIILPTNENLSIFNEDEELNSKIIVEMPRLIFGEKSEEFVRKQIRTHMEHGRKEFLCNNIGAVRICADEGAVIHGGFGLNVINNKSIKFFEELGLKSVELSPEISLKEIKMLESILPKAVMVYGRQALMLTRKCPIKSKSMTCSKCLSSMSLKDRQSKNFPVICTSVEMNKYTEVFNSIPLWMGDKLDEIANVNYGILRFTVENSVECEEILSRFLKEEKPDEPYTRGLFYRGIN